MSSMFRWSARAVALGTAALAAGCLVSPDGHLIGFGVPGPVVVYNQGVPPPVVEVQVAPPPPQYEVVPQALMGQTWSPGAWQWMGGRYQWRTGYWIAQRPGYAYYPGNWVVRSPGSYAYVPGFYRPANRPPPRYNYKVYSPGARVQVYQR